VPLLNVSRCDDEVSGQIRRERLDERAFLMRHLDITAAMIRDRPAPSTTTPICQRQTG
jgi:hypothetical protein